MHLDHALGKYVLHKRIETSLFRHSILPVMVNLVYYGQTFCIFCMLYIYLFKNFSKTLKGFFFSFGITFEQVVFKSSLLSSNK